MISGFREGDRVASPSMRTGTVTKVRRTGGREMVTMAYDETFRGEHEFPANALHFLSRHEPNQERSGTR